uniref:Uncharacterized protein n=1 Tax=Manihot esculenta TaxID=3983 RepID=A0A2C9V8U8_MANES
MWDCNSLPSGLKSSFRHVKAIVARVSHMTKAGDITIC